MPAKNPGRSPAAPPVNVWEETVVYPTYPPCAPDPNPMFLEKRVFQGSNESFARWVNVYRRAQAAGKGIEVFCTLSELDQVMETLDLHGLYLLVGEVPSREAGEALLKRLEWWSAGRIY